jgi:phenylpropionate dioxygenase-like ring-hydroxylating dioxygenase large terminal subunit
MALAELKSEMVPNGGPLKWTTEVNGRDSRPIRVTGCASPEYFAREIESIFKKSWLPVGRDSELPKPGSYLVHDLQALKTSVLVVRGKDNVVRAFHNVCSHRCNRVMRDDRGSCSTIYCRYHGWAYDTLGKLVRLTDESEFRHVNKDDLGLTPISLQIWNGFMFINLDPKPQESLQDSLADMYSGLDGYPFEEMTYCVAWKSLVNSNWKLMKDAFCEIYHIPFAHVQTAAFGYSSKAQPIPRALAIKLFKNGGQFSFRGTSEGGLPPTPELAFKYSSASAVSGTQAWSAGLSKPKLLNPTNSTDWLGDMFQLYPSLQLSIFPSMYLYHNFIPVSFDKMIWDFRMYTRPPKSFGEMFVNEYSAAQAKIGTLEDFSIVELTQTTMNSGAKRYFNLSDQELLVRANHELTQEKAGPYPSN